MGIAKPSFINHRYLILEKLKEGIGNQVFLALDTLYQKKVIIKCVKPMAHQAWLLQFQVEVQLLKRLDHPRIPKLIESYDTLECWLVEEYIAGLELKDWLKTAPSKEKRKEILLEIVDLIQAIHQIGFLYLDLKPENVLVYKDHAYLIDFNACLPIGSVRPILINKDSLPPEGLQGKVMDEKADQIGLGKLCLYLLGPSATTWVALSENPKQRFSSLQAFAQSLKKCYTARSISKSLSIFLLCLLTLYSCLLSCVFFNSSLSQNETSVKASDICQSLIDQKIDLTPTLWLDYAKIAFDQGHVSLAGYLYHHYPLPQENPIQIYRFILALMLDLPFSQEQLSSILSLLIQESNWLFLLQDLFKSLWQREVALNQDQFELLFEALSKEENLDQVLLESFMNCLLVTCSQKDLHLSIPYALQEQLKVKTPDLYSLYVKIHA